MIRALTIILLAAWSVAAQAQQPEGAAVQILAGSCANCHGPDGHSPGAIPSIAGLDESYAAERMIAFRKGADPAATVMPRLMKGYDEAEIRALARWFAEVGQ